MISDVGADTLITIDGVDTVTLAGIGNAATLTAQDFLFIGADTLVTIDGVDIVTLAGVGDAATVTSRDFLF